MAVVTRTTSAGGGVGTRARKSRRHRALPHTADAGFVAAASVLPELFEEAGTSLAELAADVAPGVEASRWEDVFLEADDLTGLAYAWLNELIALADVHHSAVVATRVEQLDGPEAVDATGPWRLRGRVGLSARGQPEVRFLRQPKAATYHRLVVERKGLCWTMRAYVDL